MQITGLITEYNPFHNGHLYHLEESRRLTGADYCIALMSGSFVQRGAPAVYDKYLRTKMALDAGVDLVIELPVSFSTASAKEFAAYSVALFTALGAVDCICFGSECGRLEPLSKIAGLLHEESGEFRFRLQSGLKSGLTFPQARSQALLPSLDEQELELASSPNNLLGIEYLRAAKELHSPITFATVQRRGAGYHDDSVLDDSVSADDSTLSGQPLPNSPLSGRPLPNSPLPDQPLPNSPLSIRPLASASAVRRCLAEGAPDVEISRLLPPGIWDLARGSQPLFPNDFSSMLNYRIMLDSLTAPSRTAHSLPPAGGGTGRDGTDYAAIDYAATDHASIDHASIDHASIDHASIDHASIDHASIDHAITDARFAPSLEQIADMSPELAARIRNYALSPCSFEERIEQLKTKQITYTRVSRALLHLLLNLPQAETARFKEMGYAPYARILGFRKDAGPLLSELKKRSQIPLITKLADAPSLLTPAALAMLHREISAAHLYQTAAVSKGGVFKNEYTQPIIKR